MMRGLRPNVTVLATHLLALSVQSAVLTTQEPAPPAIWKGVFNDAQAERGKAVFQAKNCAQCHGEKHRDWSEGIHGLNTGGWRGTVSRRLCTACHDPHAPGPIHLQALPPPELGIPPTSHHDDHEGT